MVAAYACGVDIGGSHITAAIIDRQRNTVVAASMTRAAIDASKNAGEIIAAWAAVIQQAVSYASEKNLPVGIAMPGPFDYEAGISYIQDQGKYQDLYGRNIKQLLADALMQPVSSIHFANDAACFLQGEAVHAQITNTETLLGVTLGTGLGSAWYCNGRSRDADLWCSPFAEGIAEDYLSGRWFIKKYYQLRGETNSGAKELAGLAVNNCAARDIFDEFGFNLGVFLKKTIAGKNINRIILGGNITCALDLFRDGVDRALSFPSAMIVIQRSVLGEQAALLGAVCDSI